MQTDKQAMKLSLTDKLKDLIIKSGPLGLDQYMSACLLDPDHGYYQQAQIFGEQGDFITAPEISQVFGELIGLWVCVVWQSMGKPEAFNLIELGPGRGTLMSDALRAMKIVPGAYEAAQIHLIEQSTRLKEVQGETLQLSCDKLHWHSDLSTIPDAPALMLANEFYDALPIRQFMKMDGQWFERLVGLDGDGAFELVLSNEPIEPDVATTLLSNAKHNAIIETRNIPQNLLPDRSVGSSHPLAALIVDYGHRESAIGDSFQAIRNHAFCDPFEKPGAADITAHVDFEALAKIMNEFGYISEPLTTQAEFLGALGIIERAQALIENSTMVDRNIIENQIARLISQGAMGTRFKVMGVRSKNCPPLPGFPMLT